jgi:ribose transport system substrate-binding protein
VTGFSYNSTAVTCAQTEGAACILGANPAFLSSEAIRLAVDILDGKDKPKDRHILIAGDFLATNGGDGGWKSKLYPDAVIQKIEIGKNAFPDRSPGLTLPISPSWVEITAEEAAGS